MIEIPDDELAAEALAADPDAPADPDAVPWGRPASAFEGRLPEWYVPPVAGSQSGRGRAIVIGLFVAASTLVNAAGLCVTYGVPEIAW